MELIGQAFLRLLTRKDTDIVDMCKMLRNILEYAVSTRLNNIKAAITSLSLLHHAELRNVSKASVHCCAKIPCAVTDVRTVKRLQGE